MKINCLKWIWQFRETIRDVITIDKLKNCPEEKDRHDMLSTIQEGERQLRGQSMKFMKGRYRVKLGAYL